jgi:hypothetical protein
LYFCVYIHIDRGYQIYQIHHWKPVNYPRIFFFKNGSKTVIDKQPKCFKNGGFLKTSQLHKCGFACIWYPLMFFHFEFDFHQIFKTWSQYRGTGTNRDIPLINFSEFFFMWIFYKNLTKEIPEVPQSIKILKDAKKFLCYLSW